MSAKTSDFDKVQGLVIGADDYMTKPFIPIELVARVNAQLRRFMKLNQPKYKQNSNLEFGGLTISPEQRTVTLYGKNIELTPKEFKILYLLASNPNKVYNAEDIFQKVWGMHTMKVGIPLWFIFVLCGKNLKRIIEKTN